MNSLVQEFEQRRDDPVRRQAVDNLDVVMAAHDAHPIHLTIADERRARAWQRGSGEQSPMITIDRDIQVLASYHGLDPEQLLEFAEGGTVIDIGSGRSTFLDSFAESSRTVAIDARAEHAAYQSERGHIGITGKAENLRKVRTASIRLAHASFSAPFWTASRLDAVHTAAEYIRILEPGGIALVGPISRSDLHRHYELAVQLARLQGRGREAPPWPVDEGDEGELSHVLCAFTRTVLAHRSEPGDIELTGHRTMFGNERDYNERYPDLHVPNFLMIRKT